ncbi:30S ribosomal protein S19 [Candidatus Pacearchaeota archaeon]|nr:30S ribosomal protein S19 [Candidatus Pacearchaeota archaeon]
MAEQRNKDVLRRKEFTFRGQKLEDLKKLDIREFSKLLKSNERRTLLRQYDVVENFIIRCNNRLSKTKLIRTHLRDLVIVPRMVGMRIHVHNGRTFFGVDIVGEMLGHRLGEFAPTRSRVKHGSAGIGATKSSASRSVK